MGGAKKRSWGQGFPEETVECELRGSGSQEDEWALKSPASKCPQAGERLLERGAGDREVLTLATAANPQGIQGSRMQEEPPAFGG